MCLKNTMVSYMKIDDLKTLRYFKENKEHSANRCQVIINDAGTLRACLVPIRSSSSSKRCVLHNSNPETLYMADDLVNKTERIQNFNFYNNNDNLVDRLIQHDILFVLTDPNKSIFENKFRPNDTDHVNSTDHDYDRHAHVKESSIRVLRESIGGNHILETFGQEFLSLVPSGLQNSFQVLDKGIAGAPVKMCKNVNLGTPCVVVKIQSVISTSLNPIFLWMSRKEKRLQSIFNKYGIAPKIYYEKDRKDNYVYNRPNRSPRLVTAITMDTAQGVSLSSYMSTNNWDVNEMYNSFIRLFEIMYANGLVHNDMHFNNIFIFRNDRNELRLQLIDFGRAEAREDFSIGREFTNIRFRPFDRTMFIIDVGSVVASLNSEHINTNIGINNISKFSSLRDRLNRYHYSKVGSNVPLLSYDTYISFSQKEEVRYWDFYERYCRDATFPIRVEREFVHSNPYNVDSLVYVQYEDKMKQWLSRYPSNRR